MGIGVHSECESDQVRVLSFFDTLISNHFPQKANKHITMSPHPSFRGKIVENPTQSARVRKGILRLRASFPQKEAIHPIWQVSTNLLAPPISGKNYLESLLHQSGTIAGSKDRNRPMTIEEGLDHPRKSCTNEELRSRGVREGVGKGKKRKECTNQRERILGTAWYSFSLTDPLPHSKENFSRHFFMFRLFQLSFLHNLPTFLTFHSNLPDFPWLHPATDTHFKPGADSHRPVVATGPPQELETPHEIPANHAVHRFRSREHPATPAWPGPW